MPQGTGMSLVRRRVPVLPRGPLFAQLDAKALDDIRRHTRSRRYAAGAVICQEGERGDSVLVLQRGSADVRVASKTERRTVDVRQLRAGDLVGEVGALTGLPRSATVVASSDTDALEITREDFDRLLADHPRLEANLTRLLGARLREREERGEPVGARPSRVPRVDDQLLARGDRRHLLEQLLERPVIQRGRDVDDGGHRVMRSPLRCRASPVAPRCATLRAAARCAACIASRKLSPCSRREKHVAPHTSPHPVGSPS